MSTTESTSAEASPAVAGQVERPVRPRAWLVTDPAKPEWRGALWHENPTLQTLLEAQGAVVTPLYALEWHPIETAPRTPNGHGITPPILLGFAPDEEGYSLPTREGFWSCALSRWVVSIDPNWGGHGQPTHWLPLFAGPNV